MWRSRATSRPVPTPRARRRAGDRAADPPARARRGPARARRSATSTRASTTPTATAGHAERLGAATTRAARSATASASSRSPRARRDSPWWSVPIAAGTAIAINPSLPGGAKDEDTFLVTDDGLELITTTDDWPDCGRRESAAAGHLAIRRSGMTQAAMRGRERVTVDEILSAERSAGRGAARGEPQVVPRWRQRADRDPVGRGPGRARGDPRRGRQAGCGRQPRLPGQRRDAADRGRAQGDVADRCRRRPRGLAVHRPARGVGARRDVARTRRRGAGRGGARDASAALCRRRRAARRRLRNPRLPGGRPRPAAGADRPRSARVASRPRSSGRSR